MKLKGAIFDLDGVIVNTVPIHFRAWKEMFAEYGKKFTFEDYKKKVDGIPRVDGARAILKDVPEKELLRACNKKQRLFLSYLKRSEIPIYKSTVKFMKMLKNKGIKIAVISSSKNCRYILRKIGLLRLPDVIVDGNDIIKGKPHPQIFLKAARKLSVKPIDCVVFEDAYLGVVAAKRAKTKCVGVDRHHDPDRLRQADLIVNDLGEMSYQLTLKLFRK